jgi:hypothetical protein
MSKDLMDVEEDLSALKAKPLFLDEEDDFNPVGLQEESDATVENSSVAAASASTPQALRRKQFKATFFFLNPVVGE